MSDSVALPDPLLIRARLSDPATSIEDWWTLVGQYPIVAMESLFWDLYLLESPERWTELEKTKCMNWVERMEGIVPPEPIRILCLEFVLPYLERNAAARGYYSSVAALAKMVAIRKEHGPTSREFSAKSSLLVSLMNRGGNRELSLMASLVVANNDVGATVSHAMGVLHSAWTAPRGWRGSYLSQIEDSGRNALCLLVWRYLLPKLRQRPLPPDLLL